MPRINLLPWREQQLAERRNSFYIGLAAATVAAVVAIGAAWFFVNSLIDSQGDRNAVLSAQIKELDTKISEINNLEEQKARFVARMQIIETLQRSRPEIVHVFDTFVSALPDGVYLTGLTQTGQRFKIQGVAQSSTRVSTFMRNIDASQWLKNPELEVVESKRDNPLGSDFTLSADQVATTVEAPPPSASAAGAQAGKGTS
ncbi:MAG: PilN domain-containing protein [Nevskiaceae bacterium]|jgi:type IV pilus assembly protein PilN|nr:PilN domain-containing protein [Nevskiaceae bacterium]